MSNPIPVGNKTEPEAIRGDLRKRNWEELIDSGAASVDDRLPYPVLFEVLLAYIRGELDTRQRHRVEVYLSKSARARVHWKSAEDLDLQRIAARHDGKRLRNFSKEDATKYCEEVARTGGTVLLEFIRGEPEVARDETRTNWDRHVTRCPYCRSQLWLAENFLVCEINRLPENEPLFREYLLEGYFRKELDRVTKELAPNGSQRLERKPEIVGDPPLPPITATGESLILVKDYAKLIGDALRSLLRPVSKLVNINDIIEYTRSTETLNRLRGQSVSRALPLEVLAFCRQYEADVQNAVCAQLTKDKILRAMDEVASRTVLERMRRAHHD
jgi:hypothetical protein